MPAPIVVSERVRVPAAALEISAVRSSGPGGQNVNKVASKVELRVDIEAIEGLSHAERGRLRALVATRRCADGRLQLTSQVSRDQSRNVADVADKLRALIQAAQTVPKRRIATKPSRGAREHRLQTKRRQSDRKRERRNVED